ncbi:hypothetical protein JVU11DRAFT_3226 [Chiua virens]|nr:hypothetical protein JVU11DRAFT_3226 [Chiua virens]
MVRCASLIVWFPIPLFSSPNRHTKPHPLQTVLAHPVIVSTLVAFIVVLYKYNKIKISLLYSLGFRQQGVKRNSWAAKLQSMEYRGNVPKWSVFAILQSQAAKGAW